MVFYNEVVARNVGPGLEMLVLMCNDAIKTNDINGIFLESNDADARRIEGIYTLNNVMTGKYISGGWYIHKDTLTLKPTMYLHFLGTGGIEYLPIKEHFISPLDTIEKHYITNAKGLYDITNYSEVESKLAEELNTINTYKYSPDLEAPYYIKVSLDFPKR